jgi:uncharacterized membrane protein YfbV (UPF0208 family)
MFELHFWKFALERSIKTFSQTALALFGAGALNVLTVDWQQVIGVSVGAAVLSILTSVASAGVSGGSPSLVKEKD